jgi:hypothetical protein
VGLVLRPLNSWLQTLAIKGMFSEKNPGALPQDPMVAHEKDKTREGNLI